MSPGSRVPCRSARGANLLAWTSPGAAAGFLGDSVPTAFVLRARRHAPSPSFPPQWLDRPDRSAAIVLCTSSARSPRLPDRTDTELAHTGPLEGLASQRL